MDGSLVMSQLGFAGAALIFCSKNLANMIESLSDCHTVLRNARRVIHIALCHLLLLLSAECVWLLALHRSTLTVITSSWPSWCHSSRWCGSASSRASPTAFSSQMLASSQASHSSTCGRLLSFRSIVHGLSILLTTLVGSNLQHLSEHGVASGIEQFNPHGFFVFLGAALYALEGTAFILPIQLAMRDKSQFRKVHMPIHWMYRKSMLTYWRVFRLPSSPRSALACCTCRSV